jgi:hypothetical protein
MFEFGQKAKKNESSNRLELDNYSGNIIYPTKDIDTLYHRFKLLSKIGTSITMYISYQTTKVKVGLLVKPGECLKVAE